MINLKSVAFVITLSSLSLLVACGGASGSASTNCNGGNCGTTGGTTTANITSVNHVIVMFQENRSFDDYFGQMTAYRQNNHIPINSSDGKINDLSSGNYSNISPADNQPIAPYHTGSICTEDLSPAWAESHKMIDRENPSDADTTHPMDGFVAVAYGLSQYGLSLGIPMADLTGRRAMGYFDGNDLNYYYFMASNFAMSDMMFSPMPARTAENRIAFFGATTQGHAHEPAGASLTAKPLMQLLDEHNISWKIYVADQTPGSSTNSYFTYLDYFTYSTNPAVQAKIVPLDQYFTDLQNGTLPSVAFIETGQFSGRDEHPSNFNPATKALDRVNVQVGASFTANIINALMKSSSWKDSVFFLAFDEGGGLYDHVPPISVPSPDGIPPQDLITSGPNPDPTGDFVITGFRVPNIIISPFAKKNYVSHTAMDYTAIDKFIETRWNLPPLSQRDASMPNMEEFFDFSNGGPWKTPPSPPAQSMAGICDFTQE